MEQRMADSLVVSEEKLTEEQAAMVALFIKEVFNIQGEVITCTIEPKDLVAGADLFFESKENNGAVFSLGNQSFSTIDLQDFGEVLKMSRVYVELDALKDSM